MATVFHGGMIGCGFFAEHHLEAWRRIPDVEIVAACDLDLERASRFAAHAYASAEEMLDRERLDFIDIATRDSTHLALVRLAVARKIPIVCQKPLAPDWPTAVEVVETAENAGVRFMVHENWRWQPWHRKVHQFIREGAIGRPIGYGFRTRFRDGLGDQPYPRQAYFRTLRKFLISECLVHHLDTARLLFGDFDSIYAQALRRNPNIVGEDHALILTNHIRPVQGAVDGHRFLFMEPEGPVMGDAFFDGDEGTLRILPTGDVHLGNREVWRNDVTAGYRGDSVRATLQHFISSLRAGTPFESGGREYLHTFATVEAAYRSIAEHRQVAVSEIG